VPANIQNDILTSTLEKHLKGKTKESVNFTFTPDVIKVQSSSDFVFDTYIQGEYTNDMVGKSFSIMINNSIQLLKSGKEFTTITRHGDEIVVLDQGNISIPFNTAYDERMDMTYSDLQRQGKIGVQDFSTITRGFRNLINLSKTLEVGIPPVIITSGKVYCIYSNTIFIGRVPMEFPDLEIPYNTFNSLSKNLSGSSIILSYDQTKKVILLQVGTESSATAIYKRPNLELLTSIEQKINSLGYIGTFDISSISTLELLFKCFPKETVTLSMYEDSTLGILFSMANGKSIQAGTKSLLTKCNISISTTQFDAMYKTFKETSKVEVYQGRDIICLKSASNRTLLLSGMTF
jgi:hypothetical protein